MKLMASAMQNTVIIWLFAQQIDSETIKSRSGSQAFAFWKNMAAERGLMRLQTKSKCRQMQACMNVH